MRLPTNLWKKHFFYDVLCNSSFANLKPPMYLHGGCVVSFPDFFIDSYVSSILPFTIKYVSLQNKVTI